MKNIALKVFKVLLGLLCILPTTMMYIFGVSLVFWHSARGEQGLDFGIMIFFAATGLALLSLAWLWIRRPGYVLRSVPIWIWLGLIAGNGVVIYMLGDTGGRSYQHSPVGRLMMGDFDVLVGFWVVGGGPALFSWYLLYKVYRQGVRLSSQGNPATPSQ
ncbi:hypothetical protein EUZ85_01355 [Hahella sp. KA22]|uniref:hypothetical protein n=1 Tax=Hahella sp. KA22 TaxID=1628392 RepID=UPI000FDDA105|nr:hypothetical protein [Hahella sp. KA22]AZZ95141.1 hypothetical protein ENC22_29645 [Hahella sp. KA22]QAY52786.1 hypothetical protein EUZ85_01355 [Hahella sp. KA22]